jgi:hypothetical protein
MLWWHLITAISAKEIVPSLLKQPHVSLSFFEKKSFIVDLGMTRKKPAYASS